MILLSTLNARYIHCSLGLRYLYANLGELQPDSKILEFMISQRPIDIAEQILQQQPKIVGFGVYIWNLQQTREVMSILKALRPDLVIVLGGPEISYETEQSPAYPLADYIITGQADLAFARLCRDVLAQRPPLLKIIEAEPRHPRELTLPYDYYSDEDIRQRVLYVEASRGCPFKCEFCLSSLDKTAQAFELEAFLQAMEDLYQRGARHFKFVDRTFNLNLKTSQRILQFFLDKPLDDLFLHFELIPDRLPEPLKKLIEQFPPGCLQFEIGIQSFNPPVQDLISRRQDHQKTIDNLSYLSQQTRVHLHTDLIAGLPGEDLQSFARGFDLLIELQVQEIQVGILKRLRGTPIIRHSEAFKMVYNPNPPYTILSTSTMDAETLFRINRFSRYWDMIANAGRFSHSLPVLLGEQPFQRFMDFSDWLFAQTGQTHRIALPRLFRLLYQFQGGNQEFSEKLQQDFHRSGIKGRFEHVIGQEHADKNQPPKQPPQASSRQQRHLA